MDRGYIALGELAEIPISIHWTSPIVAYLLCGASPIGWTCFFVLVLIHELGHAALVRACGCKVEAIAFSGLGGFCRWSGGASAAESRLISWGGVAAQGALYWLVAVASSLGWQPADDFGWTLHAYFTDFNVKIMLFNLLPLPFLDGWRAWPLFKTLWDDIAEWDLAQARRRRVRAEHGPAAANEARFEKMLEDLSARLPVPIDEDED